MASILSESIPPFVNTQRRTGGARLLNKNSSLQTKDVTQTFANVILPVTKFTAAICVTTNNPWVWMIDKLWVIICHILSLFLYADSLFILRRAATLSTGTVMTPDSDTWEKTASFYTSEKAWTFNLSVLHAGKENACLFIPLGQCAFNSYHQFISVFFHFRYLHHHQGGYCFKRLLPHVLFCLTASFSWGWCVALRCMCKNLFEMHKQQGGRKCLASNHSRHPGSQLCAELFSNSRHWSLKVSTRYNRHPITQGGSGRVQEVQLAAPRSTEGVTDNQHGERERKVWGGGGETEIRNGRRQRSGVCACVRVYI